MSGHLLDVNVLIALLDPAHINHDAAHHWFSRIESRTWATCPITENGLVRILSNPRYLNVDWMPGDVVQHLRGFLNHSALKEQRRVACGIEGKRGPKEKRDRFIFRNLSAAFLASCSRFSVR